MNLILVRHGETIENLKGINQGQLDTQLSDKGIEQALKISSRLKKEKINAAFSSKLKRAVDTAKIILENHLCKLYLEEQINERNLGIFQGKSEGLFYKAEKENGKLFKPENGETLKDVKKRAENFYNFLLQNYLDKTVLVVSHHGFNKQLLSLITKEDPSKIKQDEGCINFITLGDQVNFKINQTYHLK